jgi:N utilization substance protein A
MVAGRSTRSLAINPEITRMDPPEDAAAKFIAALNIGEEAARILVAEGFETIDEIAYVPEYVWLDIEGLDASEVAALRQQARDYLLREARELERRILGRPAED